ncbi:MAG: rhomboid family intramembrane serine protease [Bacteroidia bacterium]|nr:MAG: rhomboid family intramembrane serine protease [Bacteroidia bacterium]
MFPIADTIPSSRVPLMNYFLILLNTIIFFFEIILPDDALELFFFHFGLVPARYTNFEFAIETGLNPNNYFPFFTNMFLHSGWAHIIGNMWTLYIFGDNVEDKMGPWKYLLFYILCGLSASLTHYYINPDSTIPAVGASGAISGVMGAYMLLFPRSRIIFLFVLFFFIDFIQIPAFIYLLFWFLGQLMSGTVSLFVLPQNVGGIAFWAHIGGFVGGILIYKFFIQSKRKRNWEEVEYEIIDD